MICLQFCTFERFFSVNSLQTIYCWKLWFAYNFVLLRGSFQCFELRQKPRCCCDLLTILYFWEVLFSKAAGLACAVCVVICLQFCTFERFFSVLKDNIEDANALWFAYNFVLLRGSFQWQCQRNRYFYSCDLLTILYFWEVLFSVKKLT